jgi:hypothetical protein
MTPRGVLLSELFDAKPGALSWLDADDMDQLDIDTTQTDLAAEFTVGRKDFVVLFSFLPIGFHPMSKGSLWFMVVDFGRLDSVPVYDTYDPDVVLAHRPVLNFSITGDMRSKASRVFARVGQAIKGAFNRTSRDVKAVVIRADEDESSRVDLYRRLSKLLARTLGWAGASSAYLHDGFETFFAYKTEKDGDTLHRYATRKTNTMAHMLAASAQRDDVSPPMLTEVREDWLFHTTKWRHVQKIATTRRLIAKGPWIVKEKFVSLSASPLAPSFGNVVLIFRKRSIADRLYQVKYTEQWARKHPEQVSYITAGQVWDAKAARKEAKEIVSWDVGLNDIERKLKELKAKAVRLKDRLKGLRRQLKKVRKDYSTYEPDSERGEELAWDVNAIEWEIDSEEDSLLFLEDDIAVLEDKIPDLKKEVAKKVGAKTKKLWQSYLDDFYSYESEEEWITRDEGKPMPFRKGELVAVVCKNCDERELEELRQTFRNLLPAKYIIDLETAMERIHKRAKLKPLRPGERDPTPRALFKKFGRTKKKLVRKRKRKPKPATVGAHIAAKKAAQTIAKWKAKAKKKKKKLKPKPSYFVPAKFKKKKTTKKKLKPLIKPAVMWTKAG